MVLFGFIINEVARLAAVVAGQFGKQVAVRLALEQAGEGWNPNRIDPIIIT